MEEMKRTLLPKKSSLRIELESAVLSVNKYLKDVVGTMSYVILLRNTHPYLNDFYARRLYQKGLITYEEAHEFSKILPINH